MKKVTSMICLIFITMNIISILAQNDTNCEENVDFFSLGVATFENGDLKTSLLNFSCVLEQDPANVEALRYRGTIYYRLEDYASALADFNYVVQLEPDQFRGYYLRGLVYLELEKYELALEDFSMAIELNPEIAESYHMRGKVYDQTGEYELALQDFATALSLNSNLVEVYNSRGLTYYNLGELDKALDDWDYYVANAPIVYEMLSEGFEALDQERYIDALNLFNSLWLVSGSNPKFRLGLGHAHYALGNYEQALIAYEAYIEFSTEPIDAEVISRIEELRNLLGE